jgi:hypothetical protein
MPDKPVLLVLPVLGNHALTLALLRDADRDRRLIDILIVDNDGSFPASDDILIVAPTENLGWLRSCNLGLEYSLRVGYTATVLLNNDTRLSPDFFAGLLAAMSNPRAGLCGPVYNDVWPAQRADYAGAASGYAPRQRVREVPFLDGTCLLVPRTTQTLVGRLNDTHFARYGWAADFDYALRVRRANLKVYATEAAYLTHEGQATAGGVDPNYAQRACEEAVTGMTALYGDAWPELIGNAPAIRAVYDKVLRGASRDSWRTTNVRHFNAHDALDIQRYQ